MYTTRNAQPLPPFITWCSQTVCLYVSCSFDWDGEKQCYYTAIQSAHFIQAKERPLLWATRHFALHLGRVRCRASQSNIQLKQITFDRASHTRSGDGDGMNLMGRPFFIGGDRGGWLAGANQLGSVDSSANNKEKAHPSNFRSCPSCSSTWLFFQPSTCSFSWLDGLCAFFFHRIDLWWGEYFFGWTSSRLVDLRLPFWLKSDPPTDTLIKRMLQLDIFLFSSRAHFSIIRLLVFLSSFLLFTSTTWRVAENYSAKRIYRTLRIGRHLDTGLPDSHTQWLAQLHNPTGIRWRASLSHRNGSHSRRTDIHFAIRCGGAGQVLLGPPPKFRHSIKPRY